MLRSGEVQPTARAWQGAGHEQHNPPSLSPSPRPSVSQRAGFHSGTLASAAVGTVNVLGSLLAASVIERVGRR